MAANQPGIHEVVGNDGGGATAGKTQGTYHPEDGLDSANADNTEHVDLPSFLLILGFRPSAIWLARSIWHALGGDLGNLTVQEILAGFTRNARVLAGAGSASRV